MFITANEFVSEVHDRNAFSLPSRPGACGLFVGFSDDRRIEVVVRFGVVFILGIIFIIIVGVSRRHRVAHDGEGGGLRSA
jgi:hypothetical protein